MSSITRAGGQQVEVMQIHLNKGVNAAKFQNKVDEVLKDGKITQKEFQALAKDVGGGEDTLMRALKKVSPDFDRKYLNGTALPPISGDTQIKKDDLAVILKEVVSGAPVKMSKNKEEIKDLKDQVNLLKAEVDEDNLSSNKSAGKLLGAIEVIHGSVVELSKGALEGKDKLTQQTKDALSIGKGDLPKAEDYNLGDAMEVAKNTGSMASCVTTFASTIIAIKDAVKDGANVGDLKSVRNALQQELKANPAPSTEKKAELKAKIGALDESMKIIKGSMAANAADAIGQAVNTAGGLMEFSKAVAPHLADSVGMVGNVMSAVSGIVTGVATTIKESLRLNQNRNIKSRASEFAKNPAKAMLDEKVKEAKILTKDIEVIKSENKSLTKDLKGLEKDLETVNALPDTDASKARQVRTLGTKINIVKQKISENINKIEDHQDKIDTFTRKPAMNTAYKAEFESKLNELKDERTQLVSPRPAGKKANLEAEITALTSHKTTKESEKSTLESELVNLKKEVDTLKDTRLSLSLSRNTLNARLDTAKSLPDTDPDKARQVSTLTAQIADSFTQTNKAVEELKKKIPQIATTESKITAATVAIEKATTDIAGKTTQLQKVDARIAELNTEIGNDSSGLTKKVADIDKKIATALKDPKIEKLADVANGYETKTPDQQKDLRESIGVSKNLDDIGSQVIKRRSVGHSSMSLAKGLLATAGGVATTVGAVVGTVALAATPVGWALGGAAAAVGIGLLVYKVTKTVQRNKTEANLKNQSEELSTMKTGLEQKRDHSNPPVSDSEKTKINEKIAKIGDLQTRVDTMLLKKSPKAAQENIYKVLSDTTPQNADARSSMQKFVQHVFKIDPDALVSGDAKIQKGARKILDRKMPMFA